MKRLVISFIFGFSFLATNAGEGEFAVSKMPLLLTKNAHAVLRVEEQTFEIKSLKEAEKTYRYAITILNESGDRWAEFAEGYDKLHDIISAHGYLYDGSGKQLKKVKLKDMQDLSGTSDISLAEDNRVKRHNFYYKNYPYTIEYEVVVRYKYTMYFPMWVPQASERLAVENSRVTIICPEDYQFRYKAYNYDKAPEVKVEKGNKVSTWSVRNIPAYISEPYQVPLHDFNTVLIFGPSDFQLGDYKGNMQSWESFGKFLYDLKKGKDELPDDVKIKIRQLIAGVNDESEKVRILYEYMQKNTRYISIQLGIGGWQPFDARYVATRSYGDCKALSNFMYSILKEAGIRSVYTLIRAGRNERQITEDFPSNQFNHAILCVPMVNDSIWLECTSQTNPSGYMGSFTGNRSALIVDENGGKLVKTPRYGLKENLQIRKLKGVLQEDATLKLNANTRYYAIQQDELHGMINHLSKEKIKELLNRMLEFSTFDILDFKYEEHKSALPYIDERLDIEVKNFATITGKRLFVYPNVMTKFNSRLQKDEKRKYDLVMGYAFRDVDSIELEIPKGFEPESSIEDLTIETKFGKYHSSTKIRDNKLLHNRSFEMYDGRFPASDYNALVDFYDKIYNADRRRLVFVRNEAPLKAF
jgi:hypothetical protein